MVQVKNVLEDEVLAWFKEVRNLNGQEGTYYRFRSQDTHPDTGTTVTYEEGTVELVRAPISSYTVAQDSRLQQNDRRMVFLKEDFPNSKTGGNETPSAKDKIEINDTTWTLDLGDEAVWEEDDTGTIYTVYARRAS